MKGKAGRVKKQKTEKKALEDLQFTQKAQEKLRLWIPMMSERSEPLKNSQAFCT